MTLTSDWVSFAVSSRNIKRWNKHLIKISLINNRFISLLFTLQNINPVLPPDIHLVIFRRLPFDYGYTNDTAIDDVHNDILQVIFEDVIGNGYTSDIAIDDSSLGVSDECPLEPPKAATQALSGLYASFDATCFLSKVVFVALYWGAFYPISRK